MNKFIVLLFMLFTHIVDDFYLQGVLAKLKQKSWWAENYPQSLYRYDYIVALFIHAFSWAFMINLPLILTLEMNITVFAVVFAINILIHAFVDNLKANKLKISLLQDQLIHIVQIFVTWVVLEISINGF